MKLLIEEVGSEVAERVWNEPAAAAASRLAVPEVSAALAAARREGRLEEGSHNTAQREWRRFCSEVDFVELSPALAERAAALAIGQHLHGADAVHLASALSLREEAMVFVTWDRRLALAASAEGLAVSPSMS